MSRKRLWSRPDPWLVAAVLLGVLLLGLIVAPQLWLVRAAFRTADGQSLTFANLARFFTAVRYRQGLTNSALVGLASTALALLVAVPLAFAHARYRLPGKSVVLTLATMATVSPPFLGAYVWMMLLGWSGVLTRALRAAGIPFGSIMGFHGIVWVTLLGSVGLVFLFAHDAFASMDPSLEEAAMSVGASRLRTVLQVALPMATPALTTAAYLVLMAVFTDFGTPKIIGGDTEVLPVIVYHDYLSEVAGNPSMAATASLVMVSLSTVLLLLQRWFLARRSYALAGARRAAAVRLLLLNEQQVAAQVADAVRDAAGRPLADGHEGDHRPDADDDAQECECGAELVDRQRRDGRSKNVAECHGLNASADVAG